MTRREYPTGCKKKRRVVELYDIKRLQADACSISDIWLAVHDLGVATRFWGDIISDERAVSGSGAG
ncbi:hypothetical protein DZJ_34750 [Dickeya ananatis]